MAWQTARAASVYDALAPDGSEIRLLVSTSRASMVHCTLRPGATSCAARHRSVDEVWYCLAGNGELWRLSAQTEEVVALAPGVAISIPVGTTFQFRATGVEALEVIITTVPPWPGAEEALLVEGHWTV